MDNPLIDPEIKELLKDRIVSMQLLVDLSQLAIRQRNRAFSAGCKAGSAHAVSMMKKTLEALSEP